MKISDKIANDTYSSIGES